MNKKEEHNDFDKNIRNRVNSEQHVPPSHLWDKIEQDAKSYDDENFDEAVRSKIKNQKSIVPKELWHKINNRAARGIRKSYAYLKWATIPVIVLLLFLSKDYFSSNKDLSNNQTNVTEEKNALKENQKKKRKNTFTDKSISDTNKQIKEQDLINKNSLNPKKITKQNQTVLKQSEKQTNDLTTILNRNDIEKPLLNIEKNKKLI